MQLPALDHAITCICSQATLSNSSQLPIIGPMRILVTQFVARVRNSFGSLGLKANAGNELSCQNAHVGNRGRSEGAVRARREEIYKGPIE